MKNHRNSRKLITLILAFTLFTGNLYQVYGVEDVNDVSVSENAEFEEAFVSENETGSEEVFVSENETGSIDTVSEDESSGESSFDEENDQPDGYIEMPWDRNSPAADDSIPFETAKDRIVEGDGEEPAGDIPNVAVPAAYPFAYDQEASLRNYFNTELMPLRNQNPYGTCWAHSAISLLEGYMLLHGLSDKHGPVTRDVDYSELQLAYFYYHNNINPITGTDGGDTITVNPSSDTTVNRTGSFLDIGGNLGCAAQSLINLRGAVDESVTPYSNAGNLILSENGKKAVSGIDDGYASGYDLVHLKNEYQINIRLNPELVKQAIMADGMVGTSFYADNVYYDSTHRSFYNFGTTKTNHAITIVGWDDDFPASNFKRTAPEKGAWLIRNSWKYSNDDIYGYHGYFWLSYSDTSLAGTAYVYEAGDDDYDNGYFHVNQIHNTGNWSMEKSANVFTVGGTSGAAAEKLEAVSFEISKANVPYTVSIYAVGNDGKPSNEKLTDDITGTFPYAGIYTIPIEDNVVINRGDKFAVAIETSAYSMVAEYCLDMTEYSSVVDIHSGESFYGYSGYSGWYDFRDLLTSQNELGSYGNFCINAFTSDSTDSYSPSQFDFAASGGVYNKTAYTASVTPKNEIRGENVTVYYKKSGTNEAWSTAAPVNAGTYRVAIDYPAVAGYEAANKLTGNTWTFTISPRNISNAVISPVPDMDHTGSAVKPELTVTDLGSTLVKGTDYDVSFANNINPGTATASITGKGNYSGSKSTSFRIVKRVTGINLDRNNAVLTVGKTLKLNATVTPSDATDRSYVWSSTDASVASVLNGTVTAKKSGIARIDATTTDGGKSASCSITVKKKNLSDNEVTITGIENRKYTGSPLTQENLVIRYGDTILVKDADYTVAYSDNTDYGTATMTITGKGDYEGKRIFTFNITGPDEVDLTITSLSPLSYGQSLGEVRIGYRAKHNSVTVSGSIAFADPSIKPSVNDSGTTEYEVIFTPENLRQYSCASKKVELNISPAGIKNITVISMSELVYGSTLADCEISGKAQSAVDSSDVPGTIEFTYSGIKPSVADSDTTEYEIWFIPDDGNNFYADRSKTTVTVKKATPNISYEDQMTLDSLTLQKGQSLSSVTSKLPAGFRWNPDVDTVTKYNTVDEIIYAHVIYNPDPDNYNDTNGTATIKVVDEAEVPETEVKITVINGIARLNGKIIYSALPGTKVDLIANVPEGSIFRTWNVTNATLDSNTEQTVMTVGNADVFAEAVFEDDPNYNGEEPPEPEDFDGKIKSLSIINEDGRKIKTLKLAKGDVYNLESDVVMSVGEAPDPHFRSDNSKVVRVTDDGRVTAYGQGTANIILYCGNKTAKCTVTVTEELADVMLSKQKDKLAVGEKMVIVADVYPLTSASDRTVSWSVDNKKLASVAGGCAGCVFTAKKAGNVTVTAKIKTKDAAGKSVVLVKTCPVRIEAAKLDPLSTADKSYKLKFRKPNVKINGYSNTATVTAVLSNASKAGSVSVDWLSSNEDVLKILESESIAYPEGTKALASATVSACGIGYAYVYARVTDNETGLVNVNRCKVTVNAPVEKIGITGDSLGLLNQDTMEIRKGQKDVLFVDVIPESSTNINKIKWSAKGGVTVKNGVIYANKVMSGVSKVTVTCGSKKHTIFINVTK